MKTTRKLMIHILIPKFDSSNYLPAACAVFSPVNCESESVRRRKEEENESQTGDLKPARQV